MNNALGVGGVEGVGDVDGDAREERPFAAPVEPGYSNASDFSPSQKLHDDEGLSYPAAPDFVDGADIGMVQCGSRLRLTLEAGLNA